jgi:6-hydroxycyclohex-1-ene-1-carbonyl-CoA dehydrogenase
VSGAGAWGWAAVDAGRVERLPLALEPPGPGEVRVKVAGCGLCHTDLGFLYDGVPTRHPLPLVLGHEVSGVVVEAGEGAGDWVGQAVIVPAVIPCGTCAACQRGRPMICRAQVMPGNDRHGGFATHLTVPARGLCPVPGFHGDVAAPLVGLHGPSLRHLSVVADAVSTPYQALVRAGLRAGDLAVVIGLGGVGGYAAALAAAMGAHVVGVDVDPRRLSHPSLSKGIDGRDVEPRAVKKQVLGFATEVGADPNSLVILECSGSSPGQALAFGLLNHGATLCVVGYTSKPVEVRLSNLMAFDARAIGNWGCDPSLYPALLDLVLAGGVDLVGSTELRPLSALPQALDDHHAHRITKRLVLCPDGSQT